MRSFPSRKQASGGFLSASVMHSDSGKRNAWRKLHRLMSYRIVRFPRGSAASIVTSFVLVVAAPGCTDEDENAACSWLFAPASFVDAGEPGCTAEPAGERCDPSTGLCQKVCQPGEYRLTCLRGETSRFAIPEESLRDPVVIADRHVTCSPIRADDDGARPKTEYCCQCAR